LLPQANASVSRLSPIPSRPTAPSAYSHSKAGIPELDGLDFAPEPWSAQWRLTPTSEPRTLQGLVRTESTGITEGKVKATKNPETW
jgi:hypothetical protein